MIEAIQPISGAGAAQGVVQAADQRGPELQSLSDSFNRMMAKEPDPTIYSEQHLSQQGSVASHFVRAQETALRKTFDDVRSLSIDAPHLGMSELVSRHIDLTYQIAMTQMQYNAGVYLAQSSKSGLQTLMKNQ